MHRKNQAPTLRTGTVSLLTVLMASLCVFLCVLGMATPASAQISISISPVSVVTSGGVHGPPPTTQNGGNLFYYASSNGPGYIRITWLVTVYENSALPYDIQLNSRVGATDTQVPSLTTGLDVTNDRLTITTLNGMQLATLNNTSNFGFVGAANNAFQRTVTQVASLKGGGPISFHLYVSLTPSK